MPSAKRTKTVKTGEANKKGKKSSKPPSLSPKRPSTPVLILWVLALSFLAALLYLPRKNIPQPAPQPLKQTARLATTTPGAKTSPQVVATPPSAAPEAKPSAPRPKTTRPSASAVKAPALPPAAPPSPPAVPGITWPKLAIVIDDFGPNIGIARKFASLPFPVTLSVLPFEAYSTQIARMAHSKGCDVILHLPMEPLNSRINPGPGALLVSMSSSQIRLCVTAALHISPYFDGVNNHEGSKMTMDAKGMQTLMSVLKDRRLFFIDSMTINKSVGWKEARRRGVATFKRDVFLDDSTQVSAIGKQIARAVKIARERGAALAIGHPHEITFRCLLAAAPYFKKEGVQMVYARDLAR
ncbi:MAG: divergent polysaccharide deacetylase family protein [Syntrophobacteraceae bacterium]